jgi:hypothetical protein
MTDSAFFLSLSLLGSPMSRNETEGTAVGKKIPRREPCWFY